jgi:ketosteroid isomerase-like protein
MHANAALLSKLFTALAENDHATMASCYHPKARFRDIAFDLDGVEEIHDMWRMICSSDIEVEFKIVDADDSAGRVRLVENYTFGASKDPPKDGVPVHNEIESRFGFEDGQIRQHDDYCDEKAWARQALADHRPIVGFLAGRIRLLRSRKAKAKLAAFVEAHPE